MDIKLTIHKGKPNKEELKQIIDMICDGFLEGIDQPVGINWEVNLPYKYHEELKGDN